MKPLSKTACCCVAIAVLTVSHVAAAQGSPLQDDSPNKPLGGADNEAFDWKKTLEWDADVRLRFESIQVDGLENRNRSRIRARFGVNMQATENIDFGVRIATGDGNPVSTNISFDDGFSLKEIGLDRAFLTWHATDNIDVIGGKMKSPWFRAGSNSMHFDSDLNPEGAALKYQSADGKLFGSLGGFSVAERSTSDDSLMFTAQGGVTLEFGQNLQMTAAIGYFDYTNTIGNLPFYLANDSGNTIDADGNFIFDYDIIELGVELKTSVGGVPITAFAVTAHNSEASTEDTAFAVGFGVDDLLARGNLDLSYAYHDTDADAVMGIFTDSDFAGGETDSNGHFIKANYALTSNVGLGGTLILSERGEFAGNQVDYNRVQLDLIVAFE